MYTGYIYDYLREISIHTGWEYEFIEMDLSTALDALAKGEIDLLAGMIKNEATMKLYDFSNYSTGSTYTILSALEENQSFNPDTINQLDGMKIGYYETAQISLNKFMNFCESMGIKNVQLVPYKFIKGQDVLDEKLKNKEVDAVISGDLTTSSSDKRKILARFGATPYYFATIKGNAKLIQELDEATLKIQTQNPNFAEDLYNKYFQQYNYNYLFLSQEEKTYIQNIKPLKAVYINDYMPLHYIDKDTGEAKGMFIDIINLLSHKTGIPFELVSASSYDEAYSLLEKQMADVIIAVPDDYLLADKHNYTLTSPYLSIPLSIVINTNISTDKQVLALPLGHGPYELPESHTTLYYDTLEDALEAVDTGEATMTYGNTYSINYYVSSIRYKNVSIFPNTDIINIALALSKSLDPNVVNIISKGVYSLSQEDIKNIITLNTSNTHSKFSFRVFIYDYMGICIITLLIFLTLIGIIAYLLTNSKIEKIKLTKRLLYEKTQIDSLTGVYNREACVKLIQEYLDQKDLASYSVFIIIDIDHFKQINDTLGHKVGDNLLVDFASILKGVFSHKDVVARLGGDEFIVFMKDIDKEDLGKMKTKLEELCKMMDREVNFNDKSQHISLSVGAIATQKNLAFDTLYTTADELLYEVKRNGRNGFKLEQL